MACQRFSALPSSPSALTGLEIVPNTDAVNVDRKAVTSAIAQAAVTWGSGKYYIPGTIVTGPIDDNVYQSIQAGTNEVPSASPTYWKLLVVRQATTLNVPSVFSTIASALSYIEGTAIEAPLTIQVADGSYNLTTTQLNLYHPYAENIEIIGNTTTPASCSLTFSALPNPPSSPYLNNDSGSIYITEGTSPFIDGFAITKSGGAPAFGHCAFLSAGGASLNLGPNITASGFWAGFAAKEGNLYAAGSGAASPDITTVATGYAIYSDSGYVEAPYVDIAGIGDGVSITRGGQVRINNATIDAAIGIAYVMDQGSLYAQSATIGNVDSFYEVGGSNNVIQDAGSTYGTASSHEIFLIGNMDWNGAFVIAAAGEALPISLIEANRVQAVSSSTESVFLSDTGIDTKVLDATVAAGGVTGVSVDTTGAASIPVSIAVGATSANIGSQGGTGVLDVAGQLVVPALWVTANTIIVVSLGVAGGTGPVFEDGIIPSTSFTITSGAGAADSGNTVNWHAIVYP